MTQQEQILNHLKAGGTITPLEALDHMGCFRLASRISDLRKQGHNVLVDMVTVNGKTFAEYRLSEGISRKIPITLLKKQHDFFEAPTKTLYY